MLPNNKGTATVVTAPTTAPVVSSTVPTASSQNASSSITTGVGQLTARSSRTSLPLRGQQRIDIAGSKGQAIIATADGRVVYAGNALRGYGNLIIIKHNDDYLSAYAHNDTMLVREQQEVKAGQKSLPWVAPEPVLHACILKFVTREIRKPAAIFTAAIN